MLKIIICIILGLWKVFFFMQVQKNNTKTNVEVVSENSKFNLKASGKGKVSFISVNNTNKNKTNFKIINIFNIVVDISIVSYILFRG